MTTDQLSARVDTIIAKAEESLGKQVDKTQAALFDQMSIMLNKLELDPNGLILQSANNRKVLAQAETYFDKGMNQSGYYEGLNSGIAGTVGSLTNSNSNYFKTILEGFTPDAHYIKALQKQTISQAESMLANEGIEAMLKQPIMNILNQNVNTSASYSDLVDQLRNFIKGSGDDLGALQRYSKQITTDTLFNYNRALQESVSANAGLNWIKYVGGVTYAPHKTKDGKDKFTTRDFCMDKIGKFYEKTDVEKWASKDWAGKRSGTTSSTIFIYAGGYNCRHQIVYVPDGAVPKTNKDAKWLMKQAKDVGNELDDAAQALAKKYSADITPLNLKGYDSIVRKATDDLKGNVIQGFKHKVTGELEGVKDAVRTTIITDKSNLEKVAADLKAMKMTQRVKVQDFTTSSGYRGYLANVKLSNGTWGEIQINTPEMIFAKEKPADAKFVIGEKKWNEIHKKTGLEGGLGHKYYEEERVLKVTDLAGKEAINAKSRAYYSQFYDSYPEVWP